MLVTRFVIGIMQKPGRAIFWLFTAIVASANFSVVDSLAQNYPVKPIRMLNGFVPGGAVDFTARLVSQKLTENFGQQVIVENRPGASTALATEIVARAPADGYTLMMISAASAILPVLRANLPYNLQRDLAPVSLVAIGAFALAVHPSVPARSVKELIALARSQPGKLNYSSAGIGSANHLVGELFCQMAKVKLVHVPYKGGGGAAIATVSGEVDIGFTSVAALVPFATDGKLRPLAVSSAKRASLMPSIPTLQESGLSGYDRSAWYGVIAPAGVPKGIIGQLNSVLVKVIPDLKQSLNKEGLEPEASTPEQFAALIRRELEQNANLVKLIGLKDSNSP